MGSCPLPDRHEPRLRCGYPMPCPWHTVILEELIDKPIEEQLREVADEKRKVLAAQAVMRLLGDPCD